MSQGWIELIGTIAACLTTGAFFPQAIEVIRTRDTSGISLTSYLMLVTGVLLWIAYGVLIGSWPLIAANGIVLVPQLAILAIKLRHG